MRPTWASTVLRINTAPGDAMVGAALGDQGEHLAFAVGQLVKGQPRQGSRYAAAASFPFG